MKSIKVLFALTIAVCMFSCDDSDGIEVGSVALTTDPTFTVAGSSDNPGLFFFENTTPGKEDFYSFWEISGESGKFADNGVLEYEFETSGSREITLTMVGSTASRSSQENFMVTLPVIEPEVVIDGGLILNGGLEEGDGANFTNWAKNNGTDRFSEETVEVYSGARSAKIANEVDGNPWETQFVSDGFATVDGTEYTVSVWAKGDPAVIRFSTNPGVVDKDQYGPDYTVTTDWAQYTFTFPANSETTIIALDMGTTTGTFYIDEIVIVEGAAGVPVDNDANDEEEVVEENDGEVSSGNIILNGSLEEGSEADFTNWLKNNGPERFSQETEDVYEGSRAARITNEVDGNPWETQFISDAFNTEDGEDYTVSVWVKGDPAVIRFSTNPGVADKDQYGADYTVTSEWTQYSFTFPANSDTTVIALDMGATTGTFIIDDIVAVKN